MKSLRFCLSDHFLLRVEICFCANWAHRVSLGVPWPIDGRCGSCQGCITIRAKESPEIDEKDGR